ncbi:unnamed protein product [Paramecium pentaurelia]|uniref:Opioid growth factor receptor (OGFr) conserved domain-containing protein n=1 Tax=Paramecium pentaurelia TaxID=43138 RepID=A0A8S1TH96_9CILI|nr:unnamed protein product [Paramecium pentaurelia]
MGQCTSSDGDPQPASRAVLKAKIREFPNIDFYKGDYPINLHPSVSFHQKHWMNNPQNHQLTKFYSDLESDKQYMQWLYPNFFQSFLNMNSYRLTPQERNKFLQDPEIMKVYKQNVGMFLRFLGIIRNERQQLEIIDETQFDQCLFTYTHNLNRIQRFISSMSVLGMREEALEFLHLLQNKLSKKHKVYISKFSGFEPLLEEGALDSTQLSDPNNKKSFAEYKSNYVQEDLHEEPWVTVVILTKEAIEISQQENSINEKEIV